jgi:Ala-tRNA(Pro) deacylase
MATATWVKEMLGRRGIPFEERHHHDAYTAQELAQAEHVSGHRVAKVVVVIADGRPVILVLPASRLVVPEQVADRLGAWEVRLASEEEMGRVFDDCETGAIPPLRHWRDVPVLMDGYLRVEGDILFPGGTHEDALRVRFNDWFRLVNPRVEWFSEPELCACP